MEHVIVAGGREIRFVLTRKAVKNINLNVKADGRITVSAGKNVPLEAVNRFVIEKSPWIFRHLDKSKQAKGSPKAFNSGEKICLLGQMFTLNVTQAVREKVVFASESREINLFVRDVNSLENRRAVLNKWLKAQAKAVLSDIFSQLFNKYSQLCTGKCTLKIRAMKSRWGTCNTKTGVVTLNSNLIFAPKECIEYIVLHELCHFRHHGHGKAFYQLVASFMPDFKRRKDALNKEVGAYLLTHNLL